MKKVLISNIQRFCLHDGPGIRTTAFLMGCSIHCPWCANPENLQMKKQYYLDHERCFHSKNQLKGPCPYLRNCYIVADGRDITQEKLAMTQCPSGAVGVYGEYYDSKRLEKELCKDQSYFAEGGITFSGGEALLQMEELEETVLNLKRRNINLCVETALFVRPELVKNSLHYFDEYIVDIKILNEKSCRENLGGNLEQYLYNVEMLFQTDKNVIFRFPMIDSFTTTEENLSELLLFLKKYRPQSVEVFEGHRLGEKKYQSLGMKYKNFNSVDHKLIESVKKDILSMGIACEMYTI